MLKKSKIYIGTALLFLLMASVSLADTILYCQSKFATGLGKKNNQWESGTFNQERFTLKFNIDYSMLSGINKYYDYSCSTFDFENYQKIVCIGNKKYGDVFAYNKENNRFVFYENPLFGFIDGINTQNPDTDTIHAGTCTKS